MSVPQQSHDEVMIAKAMLQGDTYGKKTYKI